MRPQGHVCIPLVFACPRTTTKVPQAWIWGPWRNSSEQANMQAWNPKYGGRTARHGPRRFHSLALLSLQHGNRPEGLRDDARTAQRAPAQGRPGGTSSAGLRVLTGAGQDPRSFLSAPGAPMRTPGRAPREGPRHPGARHSPSPTGSPWERGRRPRGAWPSSSSSAQSCAPATLGPRSHALSLSSSCTPGSVC